MMLMLDGVSWATPDSSPPPMRCTILLFPPRGLRGIRTIPENANMTCARNYTPIRPSPQATRHITGGRLVSGRPGRPSAGHHLLQ